MPVHGAQTKKRDRFYIISPYFSIFFSKWNRGPVPLVSEMINERNEKWDWQKCRSHLCLPMSKGLLIW